ncbi:MAG: hypothetical protein V1768_01415 [Patescibacteria group bacterium]|nr:hypothetical protein [Patescibacteria group bacterium]MBU1684470.1 hypothetical protein [Patescibacteria group bacterium]MBU1778128.1 hypothetical protein [Patescibacteria group bacterium]MBU1987493.1 hypothetical protein [Patescibacteria group bacterium]MBU2415836.1 hypothetical protein [Patescibacteria group bacterium]
MSIKKQKIYLDTSVISAYYDERQIDRMKLTRESYQKIKFFDLYISEITLNELEQTTDIERKNKFLKFTQGLNILPLTLQAKKLSQIYSQTKIIPVKFQDDIFQIAIAVTNNMNYILSWNFKHMVNLSVRTVINAINVQQGYAQIEILAPPEML